MTRPNARSSAEESNAEADLSSQEIDPSMFWDSSGTLDEPPTLAEPSKPVLERLMPSPFPRGGFPLVGFLATLYDHVAQSVRTR